MPFFARQSVESKFSRQKCRILMQQDVHPKYCYRMFTQNNAPGMFTLSNGGQERNCSLTTLLFPARCKMCFFYWPGAKCVTNILLWLFHICHITVRCQICETKKIISKEQLYILTCFAASSCWILLLVVLLKVQLTRFVSNINIVW